MRFLLTPVGSAGDNFPFIGLGAELLRRGHDVTVITSENFAPIVRRLEMNCVEAITAEEYRSIQDNPDLWHPVKGYKTVMAYAMEQVRRLFKLVRELAEPGRTVVVSHMLDYASRCIQDKTGLPVVTVQL
ncbi:MAG: glycosyltransferase [Planctomycetota bacterium]|nr:glycosyltransferase [Planctomycetota bacterium]